MTSRGRVDGVRHFYRALGAWHLQGHHCFLCGFDAALRSRRQEQYFCHSYDMRRLFCRPMATQRMRAHGGQSMGWVPGARGREDLSRGFVFGAVRLPTPMAAEVQNWPSTTAKRLAILVDARKSKRQREGSLSELNPPALEPRDG